MNPQNIPFSEVAKYAKKVTIKGRKQLMEGNERDHIPLNVLKRQSSFHD